METNLTWQSLLKTVCVTEKLTRLRASSPWKLLWEIGVHLVNPNNHQTFKAGKASKCTNNLLYGGR